MQANMRSLQRVLLGCPSALMVRAGFCTGFCTGFITMQQLDSQCVLLYVLYISLPLCNVGAPPPNLLAIAAFPVRVYAKRGSIASPCRPCPSLACTRAASIIRCGLVKRGSAALQPLSTCLSDPAMSQATLLPIAAPAQQGASVYGLQVLSNEFGTSFEKQDPL